MKNSSDEVGLHAGMMGLHKTGWWVFMVRNVQIYYLLKHHLLGSPHLSTWTEAHLFEVVSNVYVVDEASHYRYG